ncbi:hypothetical protein BJX61DRAFT_200448 [Aspergillus egyptiacus]|nr:hypothetical protein BJX61DRAFT_200448 [Aspergillus egyptiacus]
MKFYYQVVTTPTADTPGTTIFLHFPNKRYVFGHVSEASQRAYAETQTRMINVSDIFLTGRTEWKTLGGLLGVILTQADQLASSTVAQEEHARAKEEQRLKRKAELEKKGSKEGPVREKDVKADNQGPPSLTVHGSRNLAHTLATARRFIFRQSMPVYTKEYDSESLSKAVSAETDDPYEQPTWSDDNIKVWVMAINPSAAQPRPSQSSRKRSHDEFSETGVPEKPDQHSQDQFVRQAVVANMFSSTWKIDALQETRLADVKLPATIFVRNPQTKDLERYSGPMPGDPGFDPEVKVLVRTPWPGAAVDRIPTPAARSQETLCYIVKNHDIRGKFDPQKALELGVPKGPSFGVLTKGESVTVEGGTVVTPDMVLGPPRLGKAMAIIDLPTPDYVDSFVNRPEWKSPSVTSNLEAFTWILGPGVGDHPRLREFVATMSSCKHIVSSPDYCPNYLAMQSVASATVRMARLSPENFAIPVHDNLRLPQAGGGSGLTSDTSQSPFEAGQPGLIVNMEPECNIDRSEVIPHLNATLTMQHLPRSAERRARIIRSRLEKPESQKRILQYLQDLPSSDAEITALGTGSSVPSKYRNVSSTLLHVPGRGYYLFDCGEGTLGQLKRVFNPEQLREVLQNLRLVWISHLHADHHLGTVSVLKAWYQANYPDGVPQSDTVEMDMEKILQDKRLFLVSENMMIQWLEEYAGVEDFGFAKMTLLSAYPYMADGQLKSAFHYRHCRVDGSYPGREIPEKMPQTTVLNFTNEDSVVTRLLRQATGLSDLLTTYVNHCTGAMAVSLVFPDGFKASFSGDCRPSKGFVRIGQDSTVLIHEATFQDDMRGSAIAKKHSTFSEAIEVGRQMRARSILLTHFSQRYQKISTIEDGSSKTKKDKDPEDEQQPMALQTSDNKSVQDDDLTSRPVRSPSPKARSPRRPGVPIVQAFDYMRVRVGDMLALEAKFPAIDRLIRLLNPSPDAEPDAEPSKDLEAPKGKGGKKGKGKPAPPVPRKSRVPTNPSPAWDASESESGWTSEEDSNVAPAVQYATRNKVERPEQTGGKRSPSRRGSRGSRGSSPRS